MSEVLRRLGHWTGPDLPGVAALGGEDLIWTERNDLLTDPRNVTVLAALCQEWDELNHRDEAAAYVIESVRGSDAMVLVDVLDVILGSPRPLYDVATALTSALSRLSQDPSILGAVAVEGWTRLALGDWCSSLQLRASLVARAKEGGAGDNGSFLVRALGAALERWRDDELLTALTGLASHEDIDDDVAYEIAMHHLTVALGSANRESAVSGLHQALSWLRLAAATGGRPDATTFSLAVEQLIRFVAGERVTAQAVDKVRAAVSSYLLGYRNEVRHWRQPRADTAACWADLTQALHDVADLQEPAWWEPGTLLTAAARVLDAHRSLVLLADPHIVAPADAPTAAGTDSAVATPDRATPAASKQSAVELLLRPPVQAALGSREENLALIDRWLELAETEDLTGKSAIAAVREVRAALRNRVSTDPKGLLPQVPALGRMLGLDSDDLRKLGPLAAHPEVLERLEACAVLAEDEPGPTVVEHVALTELLPTLREVPGYSGVSAEIEWMTQHLLRFVMRYIDKQSGGKRAEPWQESFANRSDAPTEDKLADSLARWLTATTGVRAYVEVSDVGGGRVDVIVFFDRLRLVVEVKREFELKNQDELVAAYGMQAVQYAAADVPFAFLAVLDLAARHLRADIQACMWVRHLRLPEPGSRKYGLTVARVQANVAPPSASSWGKKA